MIVKPLIIAIEERKPAANRVKQCRPPDAL
jgi:hypothetical protein